MEHAQLLVSKLDVTTEEFNILNNPLTKLNVNDIFRKVMQQDNNIWEASPSLKELKQTITGFDYHFKLDEKNCLDALICMPPTIRYNLLRFVNILFLDAMKRQMNEFSWPCIAYVVNNLEIKSHCAVK